MAKRKWTGTLTQDLRSVGHALSNLPPDFRKGETVVVWKKRRYETVGFKGETAWKGRYEYHYSSITGKGLVRTTDFLLEEFDEPNL